MWPHCPAALECARKQSEHAHNPTRLACPALAAVALRGPQSLLPAALLYGCWLQTEFQLRWITVATPNRHRLDYRITVVVARSTLCGCWLQTEFQLRWSTVDTKQADANDYQQKQMPLSQLFFPMISNVPGAILFWDLRLVNVKEHMAVSDIMLGITRDYWDHYNIFFYLLHFFIIEQTRLRQYHLFLLCSACRVIDSITDELMR